jgi:hypothetical protein
LAVGLLGSTQEGIALDQLGVLTLMFRLSEVTLSIHLAARSLGRCMADR